MKHVYAHLRKLGHINSGYIDDLFLAGTTRNECKQNVTDIVSLVTELYLFAHHDKSVFEPVQKLEFLGNVINSQKMLVFLSQKMEHVASECKTSYNARQSKIREIACVPGPCVSTLSAVEFGLLYYRNIDRETM